MIDLFKNQWAVAISALFLATACQNDPCRDGQRYSGDSSCKGTKCCPAEGKKDSCGDSKRWHGRGQTSQGESNVESSESVQSSPSQPQAVEEQSVQVQAPAATPLEEKKETSFLSETPKASPKAESPTSQQSPSN